MNPKFIMENNPWRAYDWYLGSTEEPDSMSMDLRGILPLTSFELPGMPATGKTWVSARKPAREFFNTIINKKDLLKPFEVDDLYDGVIGASGYGLYPYKSYSSLEIEESLENLHSAAFITNICQTSNTYLHTMIVRHGSVCQVQDPWPTSWYGSVWQNSIPRDIALGHTVGEAYTKGIGYVGTLYLNDPPQWWWDNSENVIYFGDPDLRLFVPNTKYSDANNWDQPESLKYEKDMSINGHMVFGAEDHPYEIIPKTFLEKNIIIIGALVIIIILILFAIIISKGKRK
jgi:hypothetical protein